MTSAQLLRLTAVGLCLVGLFAVPAQPVSANDPPIQISTEISPSQPVVDESISIEVTISNLAGQSNRNVEIETVYLRQPGTANTYDRFSNVGTVGSGGSISVPLTTTFDTVGQKKVELRVTARFSGGDSTSRYTYPVFIDVAESKLRGDIQLTTTEVVGTSDVTIQGDASNVGGTDAQSVLLSVNDTETVSPTPPNQEYFVGSVEASKFGTFELTADIEPEAESIPIDITYIVNDERVTKTQQIPVDTSSTTTTAPVQTNTTPSEPPTGVPFFPIGVLITLLVVSVGGVVLWRR